MADTKRKNVYTRVTERIIADLEQGVRPWMRPWSAGQLAERIARPLRHNRTPYRGINIIMLWIAGTAAGFTSPTWMTYRQAHELGGQVRKGEKGSPVVYANTITCTEEGDDGTETEREIPFMKGYTVFNVEQIDGLDSSYYVQPAPRFTTSFARIDQAERFFAATGADIRHAGTSAFYAQDPDYVQLPPAEAFADPQSYYATLAHELAHWTKHPSRLDRNFGRKRWGDEGYAREELVAELTAAFLCADLEITPEVREDHAAYIGSWLKVLRNDNRAIFAAAAHAQRASAYLHGLQPRAAAAA